MIFHLGSGYHLWPHGFTERDGFGDYTERNVRVDARRGVPVSEIGSGPSPIYPTTPEEIERCRTPDEVGDVATLDWVVERWGRPDKIAAEDVLEHIPRVRAVVALSNWVRVLQPGGILHVRVPDVDALARAYVAGELPFARLILQVEGSQDYPENTHLSQWSLTTVTEALEKLGLSVRGEVREPWNAWVWGEKPCAS